MISYLGGRGGVIIAQRVYYSRYKNQAGTPREFYIQKVSHA